MDPVALKEALLRRPFRPLDLYDPSGNVDGVRSEDQEIFTGRTVVIAKGPDRGGRGIDMLDTIMIERLEVLEEEPAPLMWWEQDDPPFDRGNGFNGG